MTTIKPGDIKIWPDGDTGPTGNLVEDNPLAVVLLIAQARGDWRPFSETEYDYFFSYQYNSYAMLEDLVVCGHVIKTLDGSFQLTEETIALCHERCPADPLPEWLRHPVTQHRS